MKDKLKFEIMLFVLQVALIIAAVVVIWQTA